MGVDTTDYEDAGIDTTGEEDMGVDVDSDPVEEPEEEDVDTEGSDEESLIKSIQKLTGKLAQKMRSGSEELESKDYKYVVNSILSAVDLSKVSDEDLDDMLTKLEKKEEEPIEEHPTRMRSDLKTKKYKRLNKSVIDEFMNKLS